MEWNDHSKFKGTHAFLGASNFAWLGDDKEKLRKRYINFLAKERGTQLHALAEQMIKCGKRCPETTMSFDQYVNDAIAYGMEPEKLLFYSENAYGTADAILYENKFLRIHDLKTGKTPVHMEQLYVYAALFCLEYHMKPSSMTIALHPKWPHRQWCACTQPLKDSAVPLTPLPTMVLENMGSAAMVPFQASAMSSYQ